jgi:hypothetical protein
MTPLQDPETHADPAPKPMPYLLPPGARPGYFRDPRLKSPVLAALLSLMPGLGQVYLGYSQLGFIHAAVACSLIALMSSNQLGSVEPGVGIFMAFFWLYNMVDAHRRALLLNEAITQMSTETPELPDGFGAVSLGFRLGVGVLLIAVGLLTLLNLKFNISLAWLDQWWPAGLVLLGLYLVVRAIKDRTAQSDSSQG